MSIVVLGISHHTSPLELMERVTVADDQIPKVITGLVSRPNVREAAVLATCNRTEVYAVAERFHGAYGDIRDFFAELSGLHPDDLHPHLYSQHDDAAVGHLFQVAAGLDSAVLGESEILGQVRDAWSVARAEGGTKATLNLLFRLAVEVGKRARTETSIGRGTASVSHAAVEMATELLGSLGGKRVLVAGAGDMGKGVAVALMHAGAGEITVANRTEARGRDLAQRVGGRVVPFADLRDAIAEADVVLACTDAGGVLIDHDTVAAARQGITSPLLIVDIAVPRDVATDVVQVPGVTLYNLDDLRDWAARGMELRHAEAASVQVIVDEEVERFALEHAARQAAPLVAELHAHAEGVRSGEIERFGSKLAGLDEAQMAAVDALTRGIVAKLLHNATVRLKQDAGTPQGTRNAAALSDLFDLP